VEKRNQKKLLLDKRKIPKGTCRLLEKRLAATTGGKESEETIKRRCIHNSFNSPAHNGKRALLKELSKKNVPRGKEEENT